MKNSKMQFKIQNFIHLKKNENNKIIFNKPGDYVVFFHNLSGDYSFDIKSSGINIDIFGLYVGKNNDKFEINTRQNHAEPNSKSNLLIKGVFYDESKFLYKGLVRIEKKAQKSHAYQKNQNLLMSSNTFVDSKPYLEILANDVFCTHGSTTGKLNKEEILYLNSRGINTKKAEKLLVNGFINDILYKVKDFHPQFNCNI